MVVIKSQKLPPGHPNLALPDPLADFSAATPANRQALYQRLQESEEVGFTGYWAKCNRRWDWLPIEPRQERFLTQEEFEAAVW